MNIFDSLRYMNKIQKSYIIYQQSNIKGKWDSIKDMHSSIYRQIDVVPIINLGFKNNIPYTIH